MHPDVWLLGLNVPTPHLVHAALLVALQLSPQEYPAAHTRHVLHPVAFALSWYVPVPHASHVVNPSTALNLPAGQAMHWRLAVAVQASDWYHPALHTWQGLQSDASTASWYVPAPQEVHVYTLPPTAYIPVPHASHTPSLTLLHPEAHRCPIRHVLHGLHPFIPLEAWYVPDPQLVHSLPP